MKKLLILLILLLASYISFSQGLGESYKTVYNKLKENSNHSNITFNSDSERKWISSETEYSWCSYGFLLDGDDYCSVVIIIPRETATVHSLIEHNNKNFVIVDSKNWNAYRQDGNLVRIRLDSVNNNLVFYYYFIN